MYMVFIIVLLVSFLLAVWSVVDERQSNELNKIGRDYRSEKIKGTIVLEKNKEPKHYSSYSG